MEINPVVEGRKKLEGWFAKVEQLLQENEVIVGMLMAKAYKAETSLEPEKELVLSN